MSWLGGLKIDVYTFGYKIDHVGDLLEGQLLAWVKLVRSFCYTQLDH